MAKAIGDSSLFSPVNKIVKKKRNLFPVYFVSDSMQEDTRIRRCIESSESISATERSEERAQRCYAVKFEVPKCFKFKNMDEYLEYCWFNEEEIPEEHYEEMFDWMFQKAQELSEEEEVRIIRSN